MCGRLIILAVLLYAAPSIAYAATEQVVIALPHAKDTVLLKVATPLFAQTVTDIPLRIENRGDTPLIVTSQAYGCRCTMIANGDGTIPPGRALEATVRLSSDAWHGPLSGTIAVSYHAGDALPRTLNAQVVAEVSDLLANSEEATGVFRVPDCSTSDADATRSFVVQRGSHPQPFSDLAVAVDGMPELRCAVETIDQSNWRVTVANLGRLPIGSASVPLDFGFRTIDGGTLSRHIERRMCLVIRGAVKSIPRDVIIGDVAVGSETQAEIEFKSSSGVNEPVVESWKPDRPTMLRVVKTSAARAIMVLRHDGPGEEERQVRGRCLFVVTLAGKPHEVSVAYLAHLLRAERAPPPGPAAP